MMKADKIAIEDRFTITDLIHKFYHLVDTGLAGETAAMFAADAALTFGPGSPNPGTIRGADIGLAMQSRQKLTDATTRHMISNITLRPESDDKIGVYYLITLFRSDGGPRTSQPAFVIDADEMFVREPAGWKILERTVMPIFSRQ